MALVKTTSYALITLGFLISIPTGLDDVFINVPMSIFMVESFGLPSELALALTYGFGLLLIALGVSIYPKSKRKAQRQMNRFLKLILDHPETIPLIAFLIYVTFTLVNYATRLTR